MKASAARFPIAVLAGSLVVWAPAAARACAVCMSGAEEDSRLAFILTTAFLSFLPMAIVGGLVWWLRRRARELAGEQEAQGIAASPVQRVPSSL